MYGPPQSRLTAKLAEKHSEVVEKFTATHCSRKRSNPQLHPRAAANASFAAAIVRCTSSSLCAVPKNAASYCDGGRYTPLSSMLRKTFANTSVFDFDAESQSVTGPA